MQDQGWDFPSRLKLQSNSLVTLVPQTSRHHVEKHIYNSTQEDYKYAMIIGRNLMAELQIDIFVERSPNNE